MVRAGQLQEAVAFDENTGGDDGFGGKLESWTERHTCRAQWVYGKGDESVKAARDGGRKAYKIKVRSCAAARAIAEAYRMRDTRRSEAWNVVEVDAITDRAWVYIVVEGPVV